jgi:hypothetical protein
MHFVIVSHARSARQPLRLFTHARTNRKSAVWRFDGSRRADSAKIAVLPCCSGYQRSRVGELLRCAWHGWEFDMRNGQSWFDPKRVRVRTYPVVIVDFASRTRSELGCECQIHSARLFCSQDTMAVL